MKRVKLRELTHGNSVPTELLFGRVFPDKANPGGRLEKAFRMGSVTGKTRQRILQESQGKTDVELLTNIVFVLAEDIGGMPASERKVIQKMTSFDRDWMLLAGAMAEAPTQDLRGACQRPGCGGKVEVSGFSMLDLDIRVPDPDEFVRQGAFWTWLAKIPYKDKVLPVTLRLRTVEDEEEALRGNRAKVPLASLAYTLSATIVDFGGQKQLSEEAVLDLPGRTLDALAEAVNDRIFGADTDVSVDCPVCGTEIIMGVDVVSYFFGSFRRKESGNG